jgi:transcriptional regulator with XRE-family HTH domain
MRLGEVNSQNLLTTVSTQSIDHLVPALRLNHLGRNSDNGEMTTQDVDRELSEIIGGRLRAARVLKRVSQEKLAEALGVTFQQVQKYETGANRISAPMLIRAARHLDQPIEFFTQTDHVDVKRLDGMSGQDIEVARHSSQLPDHVARALKTLIKTLATRQADAR